MLKFFLRKSKTFKAVFHGIVLAYIIFSVSVGVTTLAQTATADPRINILEYEVQTLGTRIKAQEDLSIDRRIAVLEQLARQQENSTAFGAVTMVSTGLLLAERLYRATLTKKVAEGG